MAKRASRKKNRLEAGPEAGLIKDEDEGAPGGAKSSGVVRRQRRILKMVGDKGFASIDDLSHAFGVTPQTIRRDINELSREGRLRRYHGGAGVTTSTENYAYSDRKILCHQEKERIAALVAKHIPNQASLFINIGTTTEEVAKALCNHDRLRVITNNLNVASILSAQENLEVIVAGGLVRRKDSGIVGEAAIDFIQQFRVDIGIIGISGIDLDGALLDFDYREVRAARAIIDNSRKTFLVTDHTKFGRNAMVRLGDICEIDALFTDQNPPAALVEKLESCDVKLYVADRK